MYHAVTRTVRASGLPRWVTEGFCAKDGRPDCGALACSRRPAAPGGALPTLLMPVWGAALAAAAIAYVLRRRGSDTAE